MKKETKENLIRLGVMCAPVFTFIMYLLPWMGYYNESYEGVVSVTYDPMYYSYFDLLFGEVGAYAKIIMWISLVGVVGSLILYILSGIFKEKEKLLIKIAAITLVAATGILFLTMFAKLIPFETLDNGKIYKWVDFMTLPYGFLIVYNVAALFYVVKKMFKKD